ncbi:MAG: alanine--tRNA ligase [Candidatus Aenigmarchaeota archaeon]|nr:alanine--tRNA ligase [Candidatus Aenigmarchaeota archaeon]
MLTDKEAKKKYISEFYKNPEKYYATEYLKKEGFSRGICSKCEKPFWSTNARKVCGDPSCGTIPFSFIGNTPAKKPLDYIEVWKKFSTMFKKFGYTPIKRYPIVARWNPTMEYTNASIAAFQPYVISGEVEPPAKRLVIPQLCFRTVDIDNVGITGSHNTVFCMIGQHMFVPPQEWDQNLVFGHIHNWLKKGLGLPNDEIIFHEDAWAGGGNLGPCMEYFSRGCELGNQVYMMYEQTGGTDASQSGIRGLDLKVLDMGMGQERNAWFSQGVNTAYDAAFPTTISHLIRRTGFGFDKQLIAKYVPYGGLLNIDEIDDIDVAWKSVAEKTGFRVEELKKNILPLAGIYSVAEHSRALLIMFNDGALPSNVGDSYNLRIILRRMLGFIDRYEWDVDVKKLFELHAKYLKPQFPELSKNLENVENIFDIENEKYQKTREKSRQITGKIVTRDINSSDLVMLYDSQGIPPELIAQEASKQGKLINIPDNFYALVAERHEKKEQKHATKKEVDIDFGHLPATRALYFDDYKRQNNTAKVLSIKENYVVLDETVAYPTSGGQLHDLGTINDEEFIDVFKQGPLIIHKMKHPPSFVEGQQVKVSIDAQRRLNLARHHTATHIINEAARQVLGNHVNQSSAFKDVDRAHLDITHYASISDEQLDKIEKISNDIVKQSVVIEKSFLKRSEAEKKYGVGIYQGGAVPGKELRIVNIKGVDVEACGGTHLDKTSEAKKIVIISSERIQDNISRITFASGEAAERYENGQKSIMHEVENITSVKGEKTLDAARDLFERWKKLKKEIEIQRGKKAEMKVSDLEKKLVNGALIERVEGADLGQLQTLSKSLSAPDRSIVLFGIKDRVYVFASAGTNTGKDAEEIVKLACENLSGRGGGTKALAQGICNDKDNLDSFIEKLRRSL